MSRKLGHPAPVALASLRAGFTHGRRGRRLAAHIARCPRCARVCTQLDAVSAMLRDSPRPLMSAAVERQIVATITAEAAQHPRLSRGWRGAHRATSRPWTTSSTIAGSLVVCAAFGFVLSLIRTAPVSLAPIAGAPASTAARSALTAISSKGGPFQAGGSGAIPNRGTTDPASGMSGTTAFLVTDTGTEYQKATLRSQVRDTLADQASAPVAQEVQPSTTTSSFPPASPDPPSQALVGCVLHLTGDVAPKFVDRATYQSEQVYVIADSDEAWVVGLGCTASRPTVIASVQLSSAD